LILKDILWYSSIWWFVKFLFAYE